jgi:hypothetical protein
MHSKFGVHFSLQSFAPWQMDGVQLLFSQAHPSGAKVCFGGQVKW